MKHTSPTPTLYEINTPIFLREVGVRVGHPVTLADVPDNEWDIVAWGWTTKTGRFVVAVNYSSEKAQVILDTDLTRVTNAENVLKGHVNWAEYINGSRLTLDAW